MSTTVSLLDIISDSDMNKTAIVRSTAREREDKASAIKARFIEINKVGKLDKHTFSQFIADLVIGAHSCPITPGEARNLYEITDGAEADRRKKIVSAIQLLMGEDPTEYTADASWSQYARTPWVTAQGEMYKFDWKPFFDIIPIATWTNTHLNNVLAGIQQSLAIVMKKGFFCTLSMTNHGALLRQILDQNFNSFKTYIVRNKSIIDPDLKFDGKTILLLFNRVKVGRGYKRTFAPDNSGINSLPVDVPINKNIPEKTICCFFNPHHLVFTRESQAPQRDDSKMNSLLADYNSMLVAFYKAFGHEFGWNNVEEIQKHVAGVASPNESIAAMQMMASDLQYLWARYKNGAVGKGRTKTSSATSAKERNDSAFTAALKAKNAKSYSF